MAQEQKQPRKSSETADATEVAPESDVAERKEALDDDVPGWRKAAGRRGSVVTGRPSG